jgi:hypothetical protein
MRIAVGAATTLALTILLVLMRRRRASPRRSPAPAHPPASRDRTREGENRSSQKLSTRRMLTADEFTLSGHGFHSPTVNDGVQKLRGQKRIEMKY